MSKIDNVILISIDSLRYDCVKYQKNKQIDKNLIRKYLHTPLINSIEKHSICFTNAHSNAPYTPAAHAGLMTGQYPSIHKVRTLYLMKDKLNSKVNTLAEYFQRKGYKTIVLSDSLPLFDNLRLLKGFQYKFSKDSSFLRFIQLEKLKKNFIFLHFFDVHKPYLYSPSDVLVDNADYYQEMSEIAHKHKIKFKSIFWNRKPIYSWNLIGKKYFKSERNKILPIYLRGISKFDNGRMKIIWKFLSSRIDLKKSLVYIFSDHGEGQYLYDKPGKFHHSSHMANDIIRIPLMIYNPEIHKTINDSLISLKDLFYFIKKNSKLNFVSKISNKNMIIEDVYSESWDSWSDKNYFLRNRSDYYLFERLLIKKDYKVILFFEIEKILKMISKPYITKYDINYIMKLGKNWPKKYIRYCLYIVGMLPYLGKKFVLKYLFAKSRYPIFVYTDMDNNHNDSKVLIKFDLLTMQQRERLLKAVGRILDINKQKISRKKVIKFLINYT